MKKKLAFISCYLGVFPSYFRFFLESCKYNEDFDFLIFTNQSTKEFKVSSNVQFYPFSIELFNQIASKQLSLDINVKRPYKLCDFKPAYGLIFQEYLKEYEFWGGTDIDVIFGDLKKYINDSLLNTYDFVSGIKEYTSGSFFIYRNNEYMNHLFQKSPDFAKIFLDNEKNYAFDECALYWKELKSGQKLENIKTETISMTHIVHDEVKKNTIKAYFENINVEPYGVNIGKNCLISSGCGISSINHMFPSPERTQSDYEKYAPVTIGDNVWIGMNVVLLPGINVGKSSIIGAGSVVTKNIPENQIWVGNPAKFIKQLTMNSYI